MTRSLSRKGGMDDTLLPVAIAVPSSPNPSTAPSLPLTQAALFGKEMKVPHNAPPVPAILPFRDICSHVDAIYSSGDVSGVGLK